MLPFAFVNWNLTRKRALSFIQMDYASIPIPLVVTMHSIIVAMLIMKSNHGNAIMGATHPNSVQRHNNYEKKHKKLLYVPEFIC